MFNFVQRAAGHAVLVDPKQVEGEVKNYLVPGEKIYLTFKELRDLIVFTQYRIIMVDVRGVGIQRGIKTIPYQSIQRFEIRTGAAVDINTELMIWVTYATDPTYVILFANGDKNLLKVQKIISAGIFLNEQ